MHPSNLANHVRADQIGPISFEQPCGPDLEYDAAFLALQQLATGSSEQQFGDALIPAVVPDWRHVAALASELLTRTVDLRIIALLTRAWTETDQLVGYTRALSLAADLLDRYWEHIYPKIQTGDDFDPLPRLNAIAALTDRQTLGGSARGATLLHWRLGQLSLRDAAAILEGSQTSSVNGNSAPGVSLQIELRSVLKTAREEVAVVGQALGSIERIQQNISANLDRSWVFDPSAVTGPLNAVYRAAQEPSTASQLAIDTRVEPSFGLPIRHAASVKPTLGLHDASVSPPLSIQSRDDVLRALENACVYLESTERGHPAPLFLRRAQRLMHMSFLEIVRDMMPSALPRLDDLVGPVQHSVIDASN